ncbi:MAG: FeoB-associated Cys-rich membrane protein [Deltaproteobacteria bacterium]|nr:FeoB-associated Cys-rich membrane protein [Deltaproteobacteria bacterium]
MNLTDVVWMGAIISGALYLLYRSLWKKQGCCSGCSSTTCQAGKKISKDC